MYSSGCFGLLFFRAISWPLSFWIIIQPLNFILIFLIFNGLLFFRAISWPLWFWIIIQPLNFILIFLIFEIVLAFLNGDFYSNEMKCFGDFYSHEREQEQPKGHFIWIYVAWMPGQLEENYLAYNAIKTNHTKTTKWFCLNLPSNG